jgi:hypothetical protein
VPPTSPLPCPEPHADSDPLAPLARLLLHLADSGLTPSQPGEDDGESGDTRLTVARDEAPAPSAQEGLIR